MRTSEELYWIREHHRRFYLSKAMWLRAGIIDPMIMSTTIRIAISIIDSPYV